MGYKVRKPDSTGLKINKSYVGERIEKRVNRMLYSGESIGDGSPLIYTDRRKGVEPQFNIRTDRFELALDAMNNVNKSSLAKRESFYEIKKEPPAGGESINATT